MTATVDRDEELETVEPFREATPPGPGEAPSAPTPRDDEDAAPFVLSAVARPLLAAALASSAAGLVTGGIFGTWTARLLGLFAAWFGVGWALLALRARERSSTYQLLLIPAALGVSLLLMVPAGGGGPGALPQLVDEAIASGRTLRPPV